MKINSLIISIISLYLSYHVFISPHAWADENISFKEKLAQADEVRSSNPTKFTSIIKELNQRTDELSHSQQNYLDYLNIYQLIFQGNLEEAILSSRKFILSDANSLLKFRSKLSLINIFANGQNWQEGLSNLSSVLKELPLITDEKIYNLALTVTTIFYNQLGEYNLGLIYAKKLESRAPLGRYNCIAKGHIVESYYKLKQLTADDDLIKTAITVCRNNNERLMISFINSYVAKMHIDNNHAEKALILLNSTLELTEKTKYPRVLAIHYSLMAEVYWQNKELSKAQYFAIKVIETEKKIRTSEEKLLSYKILYEIALAQNNAKLALEYHLKHAEADKLFANEIQAKHLAFQLAQHKSFEQKSKIKLLNEKNALLTSEQALHKAKIINIQLMITMLTVTLILLILWAVRFFKNHKRIRELAEYDALTGIYNRGHFIQIAKSALKYCKNAEQDLSIIVFDLDHFKSVNDSYGHACGDWALKETIKVCQNIGRKNDIFARLGGEEFCLLLPSCDIDIATLRAEACRVAIEEITTEASGFNFSLSASFGVTDIKTSGFDLEKLLADADKAAYDSKDAGRNRVTVFKASELEKEPLDNSWNTTA